MALARQEPRPTLTTLTEGILHGSWAWLTALLTALQWAPLSHALDPAKAITQYHQDVWTKSEGLPQSSVQVITQTRDGYLWIGTRDGLARFDGVTFTVFRAETHDGLQSNDIRALHEDRAGHLWIGTFNGGLSWLKDGKFLHYTAAEDWPRSGVLDVIEDRQGQLWLGTWNGVARANQEGVKMFSFADGLADNKVRTILQDRDSNLWVGTWKGLSRFRNGQITNYTFLEGLPHDFVEALYEDREGSLWIGTRGGGLVRLRDGTFSVLTMKEGLASDLPRCVYEARDGAMWIGTDGGGVSRQRDGNFTGYTTQDGLARNAVYCMHEDHDGVLWFGTQGGLTRLANGQFTSYTVRDGLFHNFIYWILEDDNDTLWISSNRGVFSLAKQCVAAYDARQTSALVCVAYGVADGLKTAQCEGGTQPAGWKCRDGSLRFPTAGGVARINPGRIRRNDQPPPVLIERVSVSNRDLDLTHAAKLAPGSQAFTFHYTALSFLAPEKVRFRYKLEGVDQNWVEAGARRVAFYNKIPPGNYRFRVAACNNDGVRNEQGAAFAFSLAPYFYQSYWFYTLCALAVGLAGWSFHWRRMRRAQAQFSLVLSERNRIARDLHDTLAQGFAGIAFQLEAVATKLTDAPAQAQQHLTLALNMVRHSLAEARRSVMNLRSATLENGDLATALAESARQMVGQKPVDVRVQTLGAARPIPSKIENNLLRVGQEAITNSLKHGQAGSIQIELNYQPRTVLLRIRDDGQGFEVLSAQRPNGAHFGLLGMRERAKQMGAGLDLKSSPGQGTEVEVEVPVQ